MPLNTRKKNIRTLYSRSLTCPSKSRLSQNYRASSLVPIGEDLPRRVNFESLRIPALLTLLHVFSDILRVDYVDNYQYTSSFQ